MDKTRLLALKRAAARLEGSRGEHRGLIAKAEQRIGETELQIIDLENSSLNEAVSAPFVPLMVSEKSGRSSTPVQLL